MYRIAFVFFLLWLLGYVYSYTLGGYVHVLLGIALVITLLQFARRPPAV